MLIEFVVALMAAAERLLASYEDGADEEPRLLQVLAAMRAAGASAETLRSVPSKALTQAVRSLIRTLIDGVYV